MTSWPVGCLAYSRNATGGGNFKVALACFMVSGFSCLLRGRDCASQCAFLHFGFHCKSISDRDEKYFADRFNSAEFVE